MKYKYNIVYYFLDIKPILKLLYLKLFKGSIYR